MTLSFRTKIGYGMGHILNDLCSALWFSYLLLYFHHVLKFPNELAGVILLIGQVADALSTPFVGHEADRTDDLPFCVRYGRRKTWHLIGTICVVITFAFIYVGCIDCGDSSFNAQIVYFAPFVIIFQFGWAATQISHLAILPHLSADPHERTELNAIRYAFTVLSTITVYCITWLVLGLNAKTQDTPSVLGPSNQPEFIKIVFSILILGVLFSIGFHVLVKEDNTKVATNVFSSENEEDEHNPMSWKDWFKEPQLYLVANMYMSTRLFCNLSQAYVPLYLQDTLMLDEDSIAYIPLVMFVSGLITTFAMKPINKWAGRKVTFVLGCLLGLGGSVWVFFGDSLLFRKYYLYIVAALLGSGSSTMLVTSLSITADFIGSNIECGAFVYGLMSFTDKLSNGLVVMLIQTLTPCVICTGEGLSYFRYVISYACGGTALMGVVSIVLLIPFEIGKRRNLKLSVTIESPSSNRPASSTSKVPEGYSPLVDDEDDVAVPMNSQRTSSS